MRSATASVNVHWLVSVKSDTSASETLYGHREYRLLELIGDMKTDHRGMYAQEMSGGEKKAELTGELQYRHGKSGAAGRRATHP